MSRSARLALPLMLMLGLSTLASAGPTATGVHASTVADSLQTATAALLGRLGSERTATGTVPLRADPTLTSIAQARASDMATRGYFGHTAPDGTDFADLLEASGMAWLGGGETIAWNTAPDLGMSLDMASDGWMLSASHRDVLLSGDFNYAGVGAATAGDRVYWAVVVVKGPDHTAPSASIQAPRVGTATSSGKRSVTVGWRATDPPLAVLTAGVGAYQLQWRRTGGVWQTRSWTTATSLRLSLPTGQRFEFRVRARDRAGNVGGWTRAVTART